MNLSPLYLVLLLLFAVHVSGCAVWRPFRAKQDSIPQELPESYRHYYDYPQGDLTGNIVLENDTRHYVMKRVELPLRLPADLIHDDPETLRHEAEEAAKTNKKKAKDLELRYLNRIDYYIPKSLKPGDRRPAILISPILGGNMVVDRFANYYAGRGYVVALVHRKHIFWIKGRDIQQVEDYLRTSIIRLRQAVDWLEVQAEVDNRKIGAFGISYGAVLHTVLAAVEERVQYHVLAMPAGPVADVLRHCPDRAITKHWRKVKEDTGWTDDKIYEELQRVIRTDPIHLAPYVPTHKVQVYVAIFDRVVGAGRSWNLWKALGKPDLKILPSGHYGGVLIFPYLQSQSYATLKRHLE